MEFLSTNEDTELPIHIEKTLGEDSQFYIERNLREFREAEKKDNSTNPLRYETMVAWLENAYYIEERKLFYNLNISIKYYGSNIFSPIFIQLIMFATHHC